MPFSIPGWRFFVRIILSFLCWRHRRKVDFYTKGKEKEIEAWYKEKNIFFGFGVIRSGTTFLANFLNEEVSSALIAHEAIVDDYWAYPKALQFEKYAESYINNFRWQEIYWRTKKYSFSAYGEINPFLRRHCAALQKTFPEAKFFHLVRDGREVVRSIMTRSNFSSKDPLLGFIKPPLGSPYRRQWEKMDRFEKVCWWWQADNRYLREQIGHTLQFEKLISDYDYFKKQLLDYLNIEVSGDIWKKYAKEPKNISPDYKFPHWSKWNKKEMDAFKEICGSEMEANGYNIICNKT